MRSTVVYLLLMVLIIDPNLAQNNDDSIRQSDISFGLGLSQSMSFLITNNYSHSFKDTEYFMASRLTYEPPFSFWLYEGDYVRQPFFHTLEAGFLLGKRISIINRQVRLSSGISCIIGRRRGDFLFERSPGTFLIFPRSVRDLSRQYYTKVNYMAVGIPFQIDVALQKKYPNQFASILINLNPQRILLGISIMIKIGTIYEKTTEGSEK